MPTTTKNNNNTTILTIYRPTHRCPPTITHHRHRHHHHHHHRLTLTIITKIPIFIIIPKQLP
jgi:hypothetical protein